MDKYKLDGHHWAAHCGHIVERLHIINIYMYISCEIFVSLRGSVTNHVCDGHSSPGGHVHSNIYIFFH